MGCISSKESISGAVRSSKGLTVGADLDEAVLSALNMGSGGMSIPVRIRFKCKKLKNLDFLSKSDPFCVMYKEVNRRWQKIGQTEVIKDNLNPEFIQTVETQYHFEAMEKFRVEVYDCDDAVDINNFDAHDYIGGLDFTLHEVVTARDSQATKPLVNEKKNGDVGQIIIQSEEIKSQGNSTNVVLELSASELPDMSGRRFFIVYKNLGNGFAPVYKSEIIQPSNNVFDWHQFQLNSTDLCHGDETADFKIDFFKQNSSGKHKNIGGITLSIMMVREQMRTFKISKGGKVNFKTMEVVQRHSFLDYVFGGCEINLSFAVDFTLSNGDPRSYESLHCADFRRNQYHAALQSVGGICIYYDQNKKVPMFGFGGAIPPYSNQASHCFALNGDIFNPFAEGLGDAIGLYEQAIKKVNLYGPTYMSQIIGLMNDMVQAEQITQQTQKYYIVVILTDGIINDMQKTTDEIVRASGLPISIIIIGVGDADFSAMDVLDGDEEALYSSTYKQYVQADIVQFVPFNDYKNNHHMLAKKVLEEVPGQLLNYFSRNRIVPNQLHDGLKQQLQNQLRAASTQQQSSTQLYFQRKMQQFSQQCAQQFNIPQSEVVGFLQQRGIWEANHQLVYQNVRNAQYQNILKPVGKINMMNNLMQGMGAQFNIAGLAQQQQQQMQANPLTNALGQLGQIQKQNAQQCKSCHQHPAAVTCQPCGHKSVCQNCIANTQISCFMCGNPVTTTEVDI